MAQSTGCTEHGQPACLHACLPACLPASQPASQPTYLPTPTYLPAMKTNMSTIGIIRFAVPRKSTRLYISLTLVACDEVRLVDSSLRLP